jgi:glycosyltransferase involved in cell wall biosynthesis
LPRAIDSVMLQDEPDLELIIVDDCSTDDTASFLQSLTDPRIRVIALPRNLGVSGARNAGLEAAQADVVAFLDSDDVYLQGRLSAPLAVFARWPDVVCTLSSAIKHNRNGSEQVARLPDAIFESKVFGWGLICALFDAAGTNITVRRSAAMAVGGFQPNLPFVEAEDFMLRISRQGRGCLLSAVLWEKFRSADAMSRRWQDAGAGLLYYAQAHPEYLTRHRKVATYFATKLLVYEFRDGSLVTFQRHLRAFRRAGLISGNIKQICRDHWDVKRYRRAISSPAALASMTGPPDSWM